VGNFTHVRRKSRDYPGRWFDKNIFPKKKVMNNCGRNAFGKLPRGRYPKEMPRKPASSQKKGKPTTSIRRSFLLV